MGSISMEGLWACPLCHAEVIDEHCKKWEKKPEGGWGRFTTKEERDADPELARRCDHGGPLIWERDSSWNTCGGCGVDIDESGKKALAKFRYDFTEAAKNGNVVYTEEIGMVIINDYAIAKVTVEDK